MPDWLHLLYLDHFGMGIKRAYVRFRNLEAADWSYIKIWQQFLKKHLV